jgi:hypothetical protein
LAQRAMLIDREHNQPLGIARVERFSRKTPPRKRRPSGRRNRPGSDTRKNPERESLRWTRGVCEVGAVLDSARAVHVMDREADIFELLAGMRAEGRRFVVRLARDRRVVDDSDGTTVHESMKVAPFVMERAAQLSRRVAASSPRRRKSHPAREERRATLHVHASELTVAPPKYLTATHQPLTLNVVHVVEIDAPAGDEPVEWYLLTSEPIATQHHVARIIDHYRGRWIIEEMFKALKTGCAFETRQLESERSLHNLLAICIPIAHQMLSLRALAREKPSAPASSILSEPFIAVLCAKSRRTPPNPTVRDAILGIAGLGGHIRSNGEPGWRVIYRGLERMAQPTFEDEM